MSGVGTKRPEPKALIVTSNDPVLIQWGKNIDLALAKAGKTPQELAAELEVSYPTVWRWINGKMEPRRHMKRAIARALDMPEPFLFPAQVA